MLGEDEESILRLHNKSGGIDIEQEVSVAKLRIELEKEKNCEGYTDEEKRERKQLDAEGRIIFDSRKRSLTIKREG